MSRPLDIVVMPKLSLLVADAVDDLTGRRSTCLELSHPTGSSGITDCSRAPIVNRRQNPLPIQITQTI